MALQVTKTLTRVEQRARDSVRLTSFKIFFGINFLKQLNGLAYQQLDLIN
jgi:hypothetical protein